MPAATPLHLVELLFRDPTMIPFVLEQYSCRMLSQRTDPSNGRTHVLVYDCLNQIGAPGYFVGCDGSLHPLKLLSHAYPSGEIYMTLVPA